MNKITNTHTHIFIIIISLLEIFFVNRLLTNELYYNSFSDELSSAMLEKIISMRHKFAWIPFVLTPLIFSLKIAFVAGCLYIGSLFSDKKVSFGKFWRIVLTAEIVFVLIQALRILLLYNYDFLTLDEIQTFQPFSILYYLGTENIPVFLHYAISLFNVGEIIYWVVLSLLLKPLLELNIGRNFVFLFKPYGLGMLLWASTVVSITLNLSA